MTLRPHNDPKNDSELVIGLIGALGTDLQQVSGIIKERLKHAGYKVDELRVSSDVISLTHEIPGKFDSEYQRIDFFMNAGDEIRKQANDSSALALGVAAIINNMRMAEAETPAPRKRHAYIINSIKHPDEVHRLRQIYAQGFYLVGVHCERKLRWEFLTEDKQIPEDVASKLMKRDEKEEDDYGQRMRDAFHLSDFFLCLDDNNNHLKRSVWRMTELMFGHPYLTPTFDEYAMFMAFSAALRSADLSRQVGAVVAKGNQILSTGANDSPRFGGGLYWPEFDEGKSDWKDVENGRDYMRGNDSNKIEQIKIQESLLEDLKDAIKDEESAREALKTSRIKDLTEYGRVVHAEMEALLCCGRNQVSTVEATLYCTTFPCHNCAKHIIASGIKRVVYIEPYPKSKAAEFHDDSLSMGFSPCGNKVQFEPFVGVGPRRFFDLFSLELSNGYPVDRKDNAGRTLDWKLAESSLRVEMRHTSYLDMEILAFDKYLTILESFHTGEEQ